MRWPWVSRVWYDDSQLVIEGLRKERDALKQRTWELEQAVLNAEAKLALELLKSVPIDEGESTAVRGRATLRGVKAWSQNHIDQKIKKGS